jgi:hypothetical protein
LFFHILDYRNSGNRPVRGTVAGAVVRVTRHAIFRSVVCALKRTRCDKGLGA